MAYSGTYNGIRFRSLLELALMVKFEQDGLALGTDVLYEAIKIEYGQKKKRKYIVDFYIPSRNLLIEVKPSHRVDSKYFKAKRKAATEYCIINNLTYLIVTEQELKGHTILLEDTSKIDGVVLNEKSLRALGRKIRRKMRKKK